MPAKSGTEPSVAVTGPTGNTATTNRALTPMTIFSGNFRTMRVPLSSLYKKDVGTTGRDLTSVFPDDRRSECQSAPLGLRRQGAQECCASPDSDFLASA